MEIKAESIILRTNGRTMHRDQADRESRLKSKLGAGWFFSQMYLRHGLLYQRDFGIYQAQDLAL